MLIFSFHVGNNEPNWFNRLNILFFEHSEIKLLYAYLYLNQVQVPTH